MNMLLQMSALLVARDLGVIDDPVKGRAEVQYKTARDKTWNWFTDDFLSRFAKDSALLIVMTRWHVDDLLGRFLEKEHNVRVLRYPAIAEADEPPFRSRGAPPLSRAEAARLFDGAAEPTDLFFLAYELPTHPF